MAQFVGLGSAIFGRFGFPQPKAVYGEVISLFGLVLTNAVALTLSQRNASSPPELLSTLILAYCVIAALIVWGILVILNAQAKDPANLKYSERPKHAYERGSIMFARIILIGAVTIPVMFVWMARTGDLPGQDFSECIEAKRGKLEYEMSDSKTSGIIVHVSGLDKTKFPHGVPSQINLEITLKGELAKKWKVNEVVGYFTNPKGNHEIEFQPAAPDEDPKTPYKLVYLLEKLEAEKEYIFKVHLRSRQTMTVPKDFEDAKVLIEKRGEIEVVFCSKKKR